jgi:hypothetical protein
LHTDDPARFDRALEALEGQWAIGDEAPIGDPLILGRIDAYGR